MTNLKDKIKSFGIGALTLALAGSLNSCRDSSKDFCKTGKYNEYEVRIVFDGAGRKVIIDSDIDSYIAGKAGIFAREYIEDLKDKKRFSEIEIDQELPLTNPLIKYANLDSLEKIYNYVKENGEDCK